MMVFRAAVTITMWSKPERTASSTPYWMTGLSTTFSISLGEALVAGSMRVPSPAAGKTAVLTSCVSRVADMVGRSREYTLAPGGQGAPMRLFIALTLPDEIRARLIREQERLAGLGLPFRWVREDALHLTLVFLGETTEGRLPHVQEAIDWAAERVAPLALEANGIGTFPPRGTPRVVWAGVGGGRASLTTLQAGLTTALSERGFELDDKAFSPHITLGRLATRVPAEERDRVSRVNAYRSSHKEL